jgi:hypothetical protein
MKDPLFYLTDMVNKLQAEVLQLTRDASLIGVVKASFEREIAGLVNRLDQMTKDRDRWLNVAGIMHEYLQEGDPEAAKQHYEDETIQDL